MCRVYLRPATAETLGLGPGYQIHLIMAAVVWSFSTYAQPIRVRTLSAVSISA